MITENRLVKLRQQIKMKQPLIHCITNHISIDSCANAVLAMGAKPIMAEHPAEVAEITAEAQALMVNLGNLSDVRMKAMDISVNEARIRGVPWILDVVGVGCSQLRLNFAHQLMEEHRPMVMKGNESEIRAICGLPHHAKGVDTGEQGSQEQALAAAKRAAVQFNTVVLLSGKVDLITDGQRSVAVYNGDPLMPYVTGTGCMQGVVAGTCLSVIDDPFDGAVAGAVLMGLAGEYAAAVADGSISRFTGGLLDGLFAMDVKFIQESMRIEVLEGDYTPKNAQKGIEE